MEIPESRIEEALIRLEVLRSMRDDIPKDSPDDYTWHDRWRHESMVRVVESVLDDLGIAHG